MKRVASLFVILLLLFSLVSCGISSETTPPRQSLIELVESMSTSSETSGTNKLSQEVSSSASDLDKDTALGSETQSTKAAALPSSSEAGSSAENVSSEMKVHFLDVGQGAAVLFQIDDKVLVFDGGDRDTSSFVVSYLKKQAIKQVDVMIASHYDADHINGLVGILNVFPVKQVYDANYSTDTRVYLSFKKYIQDHSIPEDVPGMRQSIQVGEATVTFIAPKTYGHAEVNDDSICIRVQFGETSFVIMGDSSADAEQQILSQNLESDVFYASHHGSNGSNSKTLLANVNPEFVVISCGADNSYGHPGDNTLNRIKATGAELFRTDKQGTIVATSDGGSIQWSQDPCNDFTPGEITSPTTVVATVATAAPTAAATTQTAPPPSGGDARAYVLNTNTMKFHYPSCSSAADIYPENRQDVVMTRQEIIDMGYVPCKRCDP